MYFLIAYWDCFVLSLIKRYIIQRALTMVTSSIFEILLTKMLTLTIAGPSVCRVYNNKRRMMIILIMWRRRKRNVFVFFVVVLFYLESPLYYCLVQYSFFVFCLLLLLLYSHCLLLWQNFNFNKIKKKKIV